MTDNDRLTANYKLMTRRLVLQSGCWLYTGGKTTCGYGQVNVNGRRWQVHRLAAILYKNWCISGMVVMHSCDNPACFNPVHLRLGTQTENLRDMLQKGRHPRLRKTASDICIHGHRLSTLPTFVRQDGYRRCRECKREQDRRRRREGKA